MVRPALRIAALAVALPALAQEEAPEVANREAAAWHVHAALMSDMLPPQMQGEFMTLAWHATAANLCADLFLDHERFGTAFARLEHADMASLSSEQHEYFRHHLAVNFGVAVGILLAEHAGTPEEVAAFCEDAVAFALDPAHETVFDTEGLAAAAEGAGPAASTD